MRAEDRVGRDPGCNVVLAGSGLLGEDRCERVGVRREHELLPRPEHGALVDHAGGAERTVVGVGVAAVEEPAWLVHEPAERGEHRFVTVTIPDRVEQVVLERADAPEDEVFLGREVVENGLLRHVRGRGDLGDGDPVEAALGEQ